MDIFEKVMDGRTALEKLTSFIPGWKGYQERQNRRKADQTMRSVLADQLATQRGNIEAAQKDLINHGQFDLLDDLGSAVTQLQTFIDRVRFATYGYSGLFDAVKVNEEELERLYGFDAALFQYVERLQEATAHLRDAIASGEGVEQVINIIQEICREANATFDQREHVILGSQ